MKKASPPSIWEAWSFSNGVDWGDAAFDVRKAAVCVAFSELVYYRVPGWELGDDHRMWMVPCIAHQQIARGMMTVDFAAVMHQLDLPQESFTVVETDNIIALLVRIRGVIIVALRGTQNFYDAQLDFMIGQQPWPHPYSHQMFHAGFYREAVRCLGDIQTRLATWANPLTPIYLTGHSLGGAIAAVMATMEPRREVPEGQLVFTSSYTFGMPRFANPAMMAVDRVKPFPILRPRDPVPWLPPQVFNYAECPEEFGTTGAKYLRGMTDSIFSRALYRNHGIERYRRDIHAPFLRIP